MKLSGRTHLVMQNKRRPWGSKSLAGGPLHTPASGSAHRVGPPQSTATPAHAPPCSTTSTRDAAPAAPVQGRFQRNAVRQSHGETLKSPQWYLAFSSGNASSRLRSERLTHSGLRQAQPAYASPLPYHRQECNHSSLTPNRTGVGHANRIISADQRQRNPVIFR